MGSPVPKQSPLIFPPKTHTEKKELGTLYTFTHSITHNIMSHSQEVVAMEPVVAITAESLPEVVVVEQQVLVAEAAAPELATSDTAITADVAAEPEATTTEPAAPASQQDSGDAC